jgi:hypothetical protein
MDCKILFLDIDGVLNTHRTPLTSDGFLGIDPYMVILLDRIIQATGCKIVLSSSWRLHPESLETVKKTVCEIYDVTPSSQGLSSRGTEIKQWLDAHLEVTKFACIDDNTDFLDGQKLFKTEYYGGGLTEELSKEIIKYFNE